MNNDDKAIKIISDISNGLQNTWNFVNGDKRLQERNFPENMQSGGLCQMFQLGLVGAVLAALEELVSSPNQAIEAHIIEAITILSLLSIVPIVGQVRSAKLANEYDQKINKAVKDLCQP